MGKYIILLISILSTLLFSGCANNQGSNLDLVPETRVTQIIENLFPEGTTVGDLDLSGIDIQEGKKKLQAWSKEKLAESLIIVYNGTEIEIIPQEMGIDFDLEQTWKNIIANPIEKNKGVAVIEQAKASKVLEKALAPYTRPPVDANFKVENDQFVIKPAENGYAFDIAKILEEIGETVLSDSPRKVRIENVEVPARVTTEDLQEKAFEKVIGQFSTQYNPNDKNRSKNLEIAVAKLDKTLLKPGEVISFNDKIGPRTAETGFKDAYIIIRNKYVKGMGGGICQVSSTLYNAALLANMTVVERHPHAVAVTYIPLGQDATVNYPNLDLKLRNDTQGYIYIRTKAEKGKLTVSIYGKDTGTKVRLERKIEKEIPYETIREINPDLHPGAVVQEQVGYKGYIVKTWKILTDAQGQESKTQLNYDHYAPTPRILSIGAD